VQAGINDVSYVMFPQEHDGINDVFFVKVDYLHFFEKQVDEG
jgi:hypothetical protein